MYVAEFAECKLFGIEDASRLRAVGWLERGHDYSHGDVSSEFMRALMELLLDPWQPVVTAGVHRCTFCRFTGGPGVVRFGSIEITVGSSNLFVPGLDVVYVAPSLIAHYVDAHDYAPPGEFQEAVLSCPAMRSMAYLKAIRSRMSGLVELRSGRRS